jgi:hypothetical protein
MPSGNVGVLRRPTGQARIVVGTVGGTVDNRTSGRRRLLALGGVVLAALGAIRSGRAHAASGPAPDGAAGADHELRTAAARQEIMALRHGYAIATDLLGKNKEPDAAEGLAIYRRIFAADARIGADGIEPVTGPDAWANVVKGALAPYAATQHLIGTQYITGLELPDGNGGGRARMKSYLQAWHSKADGDLWLYMGLYEDELVHDGAGWRIGGMMLRQIAADYRKLGKQPSA